MTTYAITNIARRVVALHRDSRDRNDLSLARDLRRLTDEAGAVSCHPVRGGLEVGDLANWDAWGVAYREAAAAEVELPDPLPGPGETWLAEVPGECGYMPVVVRRIWGATVSGAIAEGDRAGERVLVRLATMWRVPAAAE